MTEDDESTVRRRDVLAAGVGIAVFGAAGTGYHAGTAQAQSSPTGTIGTPANPYEVAYVDRLHFQDTTQSSPDDGTFWYDSSA